MPFYNIKGALRRTEKALSAFVQTGFGRMRRLAVIAKKCCDWPRATVARNPKVPAEFPAGTSLERVCKSAPGALSGLRQRGMLRMFMSNLLLVDEAFEKLCLRLMSGGFAPGDRVSARQISGELGLSLTPLREAIQRLVALGALEARANASAQVPILSPQTLLDIARLRMLIEGELVVQAASKIRSRALTRLRSRAAAIEIARSNGNRRADFEGVQAFHFELYAIAEWPTAFEVASQLWLRTGPYLNLLYSGYIQQIQAAGQAERPRNKLLDALERREGEKAKALLREDISQALQWVANRLHTPESLFAGATPRSSAKQMLG